MPRKTALLTDAPRFCQLIDLLNETGRLKEREVLPIHERQVIGTDTRSYLIH